MKKNNKLSIMEEIKRKAEEVKIDIKDNDSNIKEQFYNDYRSIINFDDLEISEVKIKNELVNYEKDIAFNANEIKKNTIELSKAFSKAQKLLSGNKNGIFTKWYENLGFKKNFVYMLLKRNDLFLEYDDLKVFEIPEKAIKSISRLKDKVDTVEINEIINSLKPAEIAKQKENLLKGIILENEEVVEVIENVLYSKAEKVLRADLYNEIGSLDSKKKIELEKYLKKIEELFK